METMSKSEEAIPMPCWVDLAQRIFLMIFVSLLLTNSSNITTVLVQLLVISYLLIGIFSIINLLNNTIMGVWSLLAGILGILAMHSMLLLPSLWRSFQILFILIILLGIDKAAKGLISFMASIKKGNLTASSLGGLCILLSVFLLGSPLITAFTVPFL